MAYPPELGTALRGLQVLDDRTPLAVAAAVERDFGWASEVGRGRRAPTYRIWENGRALVITPREARLPAAEAAAGAARAEGWPVVSRDSGGTAVPHGPGIVQASLLLGQDGLAAHALDAVYEALCAPVRRALATLGIAVEYGEVPGSFCDGRFNLVAHGRKIAGTSQRWRGGLAPTHRPGASVVAHMVLFVEADMAEATAAVNRFYERAGAEERFDPDAVITAQEGGAHGGQATSRLTDVVRKHIADEAAALTV
jgi:lipoate-protein ligase A